MTIEKDKIMCFGLWIDVLLLVKTAADNSRVTRWHSGEDIDLTKQSIYSKYKEWEEQIWLAWDDVFCEYYDITTV